MHIEFVGNIMLCVIVVGLIGRGVEKVGRLYGTGLELLEPLDLVGDGGGVGLVSTAFGGSCAGVWVEGCSGAILGFVFSYSSTHSFSH